MHSVVYDLTGKAKMISGGIGCLRLAMKDVERERIKFLCASSSGTAHKGFVVGMRPDIYNHIARIINKQGAAVADLKWRGSILAFKRRKFHCLYRIRFLGYTCMLLMLM
jgi:hypothetical protein